MPTDAPLLRFMALSAIIGFIVFCGSYALLVWRKRRPAKEGAALRRWSMTLIVFGILGMAITLVVRETVRADGMLGGDGLVAVRAAQGSQVIQIAEEGPVKKGDVLVRFASAELLAKVREAEFQRDLIEKQRDILELQPLPMNAELVRRHEHASAERRQLLSSLTFVLPSREAAVRETLNSLVIQRDTLGRLENELRVAKGDYAQAVVKHTIAKRQLAREKELGTRQGVSANEINEREKEVGTLEAEVKKQEHKTQATEQQLLQCRDSLDKLEKLAAEQNGRLGDELAQTRKELEAAKEKCKEFDKLLYEDEKIARQRRDRELDEINTRLLQAEAQVQARRNELEVRAPYDCRVVFRHPSPGAALNHGPVLVYGPTDGLRFRFRLSDDQVDALRRAGTIYVDLEETANNIEQRFPGKFLQATALQREPGMSLVELDCQAPPETVAALAEGKPIKARFSWKPPVMNLWPFPISLILFGLGVFGMFLTRVRGWKPGWPSNRAIVPSGDDEDITVSYARVAVEKEGDTEENRADTIPERPLFPEAPAEVPVPWEHPVGIRLREAIIREEISPELIDTLESAIEQKQGKVIDPIRAALNRVPTVPDHARRLLDKLNNADSGDEMKVLEKRCLAQRLTFLLYTIGIDIPGHARSGVYQPVSGGHVPAGR